MKKMSAEERIAELKKTLEYHIDRYYNQDSPEISDYEYDMMMQELKGLEKEHPELVTPDSPTQRVGGTAKREAGVLVRHNVPMLSLQDVFSKEEVFNFVEEMQKQLDHPEFVVEYKIDGLSMSLRYENGELILAETRGDGINFGEDVTANAKVIKDVKQKLKDKPEYLEIRGEVYMKNAAFEKVNETQELLGKKVFANPRNCAAGTLRQLDSKVTKERDLSMFIFNIQQVRGMEFATHTEGYEFLKKQGIHVIDDYKVCTTAEEVWDAITAIGENRGNLAYDIDGAVVKINRFSDREQLGETSKVPRWAIAYKYPPEEKESRLLNIELSVGRTGRITPTAVFEPVRLCGTSVSRATLHNQDFIDDLDIGIGDTIVVYKSGEIIPKIKEIVYMGGGFRVGNKTALAEFNVWLDPEAAQAVLDCNIPFTFVTLDATHSAYVTMEDAARFRAIGTRPAEVVASLCEQRIAGYGEWQKVADVPAAPVHDPLTIAYLVDPTVITDIEDAPCVVDCGRGAAYGVTLFDIRNGRAEAKAPNCRVALKADREKYVDILCRLLENTKK